MKIFAFLFAIVYSPAAHSVTINGSRLVEDFSTDDYADYSASSGIWNTVDRMARAGAVVAGNPAKPFTFGDGSDGVVDTSGGYVFNTDTHPNGYNFRRVNITGGTITVTGTNPLVIRSLTTINISPSISIRGGSGNNGSTTGSSTVAGGTGSACRSTGGTGGSATGIAAADADGGDGIKYDGTTEVGTLGGRGSGANASDANAPVTGPAAVATWDTTANAFVCGTGGGGGGGSSPGGGNFSTGGSGGAGGGAIRLVAMGDLTVGAIDARGGDGGLGLANGGATCSGHGSAGVGGAVWFQTLKTLTAPNPTIAAANSGTGNGCGAGAGAGVPGRNRGDAETSGGAFAATSTTANAAPSQTYTVQSKSYDLGVLNANFTEQPSISSQANGGAVSVSFAGSENGTSFSDFSNDLTSLSGKGYRYLKFKISIVTAGAAGTSPDVTQIALNYGDAGLRRLELKLSPGCGTIRNADTSGKNALKALGPWATFWALAYCLLRYGWVMTIRRAILKLLPAKSRPEIT